MDIGKRIKERREELGLSQEKLAEMVGYTSRTTVNKIERGANNLKQSKIIAFAKALQCSPSYLMGWTDEALAESSPAYSAMRKTDSILAFEYKKKLIMQDIDEQDLEIIVAYMSADAQTREMVKRLLAYKKELNL